MTATANTNMFTYEIAPVFILMEHACLKKMREIIGFTDGDSILAPGKNKFCKFTRLYKQVHAYYLHVKNIRVIIP